jgi:intracellular sulfur oxidation DsrE/DsrF family protein
MLKLVHLAPILFVASLSLGQVHRAHRVVIELNVPGPAAYQAILGNVENIRKAFAPDPIQVEIVCRGPGINMLIAKDNRLTDRIRKAQKAGVVFAGCSNTMRAMHLDRKFLFPFVQVVDAGVAEVVRKQEAGWSYLKGG